MYIGMRERFPEPVPLLLTRAKHSLTVVPLISDSMDGTDERGVRGGVTTTQFIRLSLRSPVREVCQTAKPVRVTLSGACRLAASALQRAYRQRYIGGGASAHVGAVLVPGRKCRDGLSITCRCGRWPTAIPPPSNRRPHNPLRRTNATRCRTSTPRCLLRASANCR